MLNGCEILRKGDVREYVVIIMFIILINIICLYYPVLEYFLSFIIFRFHLLRNYVICEYLTYIMS